jgi:hypothetical protein
MSFKTLGASIVKLTGDVFGESIIYTPSVGSPISIQGIFEHAFVDVEGIVSLKATLRINLADLSASPDKGDQVTVSGVVYRITESRVDAYGGTTLILQKA